MRCAAHPEVETSLACGKCGKPICPKCLVQTPVGARCRECAKLKRLPTYEIAAPHYLKAVGVGLCLAVVLGIVWGLLSEIIPFIYLEIVIAAVVGYVIGELTSLTVNHRRGTALQIIAGISLVLSYLVSNIHLSGGMFTFFVYFSLYDLLALALGIFIAASRLR